MSNVQQNQRTSQPEDLENIKFTVPSDFKLAVDRQVTEERSTLKDFCIRALAEKLGIPVPGEEQPEPKRKRA